MKKYLSSRFTKNTSGLNGCSKLAAVYTHSSVHWTIWDFTSKLPSRKGWILFVDLITWANWNEYEVFVFSRCFEIFFSSSNLAAFSVSSWIETRHSSRPVRSWIESYFLSVSSSFLSSTPRVTVLHSTQWTRNTSISVLLITKMFGSENVLTALSIDCSLQPLTVIIHPIEINKALFKNYTYSYLLLNNWMIAGVQQRFLKTLDTNFETVIFQVKLTWLSEVNWQVEQGIILASRLTFPAFFVLKSWVFFWNSICSAFSSWSLDQYRSYE